MMPRDGGGGNVPSALIVDDDPALRGLFQRIFERVGWRVDVAACGASALEAFAASPYELLLSDVDLGDINGIDLARAMLGRRPGLRVILVSGNPRNLERARSAGFHGCLLKPFILKELLRLAKV